MQDELTGKMRTVRLTSAEGQYMEAEMYGVQTEGS